MDFSFSPTSSARAISCLKSSAADLEAAGDELGLGEAICVSILTASVRPEPNSHQHLMRRLLKQGKRTDIFVVACASPLF